MQAPPRKRPPVPKAKKHPEDTKIGGQKEEAEEEKGRPDGIGECRGGEKDELSKGRVGRGDFRVIDPCRKAVVRRRANVFGGNGVRRFEGESRGAPLVDVSKLIV